MKNCMSDKISYSKDGPLNAYEKNLLHVFTLLQFILGCTFLPIAIYSALLVTHSHSAIEPDLLPYYGAAKFLHSMPSDLYRPAAYVDFYHTLRPDIKYINNSMPYIAPPTLALLLMPLGWLSYEHAIITWSAVNVFLCFVLAGQLGALAKISHMPHLKLFFQSCVFGLTVTFYILQRCQMTLLICVLLSNFLLSVHRNKERGIIFWLALLLQIRPPLFLPIFFYIVGCRQWRMLISLISLSLLFTVVDMVVIDQHVWQDYSHLLHQFATDAHGDMPRNIYLMGNMAGWISNMTGSDRGNLFSLTVTSVYMFACIACFAWPWLAKKKLEINRMALIIPLGLFASPYLHLYDTILLLPISVIITSLLLRCGQVKWMWLCYICASYAAGLSMLYSWEARMLMLLLCMICLYLMMNEKKWHTHETSDTWALS